MILRRPMMSLGCRRAGVFSALADDLLHAGQDAGDDGSAGTNLTTC